MLTTARILFLKSAKIGQAAFAQWKIKKKNIHTHSPTDISSNMWLFNDKIKRFCLSALLPLSLQEKKRSSSFGCPETIPTWRCTGTYPSNRINLLYGCRRLRYVCYFRCLDTFPSPSSYPLFASFHLPDIYIYNKVRLPNTLYARCAHIYSNVRCAEGYWKHIDNLCIHGTDMNIVGVQRINNVHTQRPTLYNQYEGSTESVANTHKHTNYTRLLTSLPLHQLPFRFLFPLCAV